VGFDPGNTPFSFWADGALVGFDIELYQIADVLGVKVEFMPSHGLTCPACSAPDSSTSCLACGTRPYWFASLRLSQPYHRHDGRRDATASHEFATIDGVRRLRPEIRRAARHGQIAATLGDSSLSDAVFIRSRPRRYFSRTGGRSRRLHHARRGRGRETLHPGFAVVVPQPNPVQVPFAFGVALDGEDLADAINQWIVFADSEGAIPRAYDYWVLGQGAKDERPRWSILRDVLGWRRWPVTH
jgi:hypothetical protein